MYNKDVLIKRLKKEIEDFRTDMLQYFNDMDFKYNKNKKNLELNKLNAMQAKGFIEEILIDYKKYNETGELLKKLKSTYNNYEDINDFNKNKLLEDLDDLDDKLNNLIKIIDQE